MRRIFKYVHNDLYLELICLIILGLSFCFESVDEVFSGYWTILCSPSILVTDYSYIAGIGATLFNVSTIMMFNIILLKLLHVKMTGPVFSGVMMITGFSFFGKNIFNTLPIYFGIWLFSKYKRILYKNLMISVLFSTGLSPLVSYAIFGFGLPFYFSIPLGIISGIISGFIIPAFSAHTMVFHEGYNLYNTGFALGIISALFYAVFTLFGLDVATVKLYDDSESMLFYYALLIVSLFFIVFAFIGDACFFDKYIKLVKKPGRIINDFITEYGVEAVMFNIGIIGVMFTLLFFLAGVPLNGILFGSVISVMGCAAFGVNPKNLISIWVGAILALLVRMISIGDFKFDVYRDLSVMIAFTFSAGLSPISGRYGFIYGVFGGFLHIALTPLVVSLQGGFDLYNNGLSAGFEASVLVVCAQNVFTKERKKWKKKTK